MVDGITVRVSTPSNGRTKTAPGSPKDPLVKTLGLSGPSDTSSTKPQRDEGSSVLTFALSERANSCTVHQAAFQQEVTVGDRGNNLNPII